MPTQIPTQAKTTFPKNNSLLFGSNVHSRRDCLFRGVPRTFEAGPTSTPCADSGLLKWRTFHWLQKSSLHLRMQRTGVPQRPAGVFELLCHLKKETQLTQERCTAATTVVHKTGAATHWRCFRSSLLRQELVRAPDLRRQCAMAWEVVRCALQLAPLLPAPQKRCVSAHRRCKCCQEGVVYSPFV